MNVDNNLNNTEYMQKVYIGTYFPRSVTESYNIFIDLFSNFEINNKFACKSSINVLDLGAGTGGNLIGLLHALVKTFGNEKIINIYSIEGNKGAIEYQKKFVNKFMMVKDYNKINLTSTNHTFINASVFLDDVDNLISNNTNNKFDIIMSFKFFTEFYNYNYFSSRGLFSTYADLSANYLSDEGLSVLLDVTTTDLGRKRPFTPIIMTQEVKEYLKDNNELEIILPKSCALWYNVCKTNNCFSQKVFRVSHSHKICDKSKVCFIVFAKPLLATKIVNDFSHQTPYAKSYKDYNNDCYWDEYCNCGVSCKLKYNLYPSAFKLYV
jgi:hypothetical protein